MFILLNIAIAIAIAIAIELELHRYTAVLLIDSLVFFSSYETILFQQVDAATMNSFNNEAIKLGLMGVTIVVSSGLKKAAKNCDK